VEAFTKPASAYELRISYHGFVHDFTTMNSPETSRRLTSAIDAAARLLVEASLAESQQLEWLPKDLQPANRTQAYMVQSRVRELTGQPIAGWKIAATSAAGQQHLGVDGPLAGQIPLDHVHVPNAPIDLCGNHMRIAEIEFAFVLARDITPGERFADRDNALDAVAELRFGIEFPDTRFVDVTAVGALQIIADNACTRDYVLGETVQRDWRSADLAQCEMVGVVAGDAGRRQIHGSGDQVLGHPVDALIWLLRELGDYGYTIRKGQFVTTGSCCPPFAVYPGDLIEAHLGSLGLITARSA
jgi:2-keto-4-pentenoate hydratase